MDGFLGILFFFVVIVLTAVVFFGWLTITVTRALFKGLVTAFMPSSASQPKSIAVPGPMVRCTTHGCYASNPAQARFCRRCGRGLPEAQRVQVRRAAVW